MIKYYQVARKEMKDVKSRQHVCSAAATKYHQVMKDQKLQNQRLKRALLSWGLSKTMQFSAKIKWSKIAHFSKINGSLGQCVQKIYIWIYSMQKNVILTSDLHLWVWNSDTVGARHNKINSEWSDTETLWPWDMFFWI